uniref:Innexin n=1 Tax=Metapenaeus ensis majanivirus TaxID=2984279 RepID=A0A9C7BW44_9VIRU|nr:MAG: innexin [Metapenaeus ensis majanivirus]
MIPISVLANLRSLFKGKNSEVDINSKIFKLQYRTTTTILFCLCLLITTNSLVGNPISCLYDSSISYLKEDTVNTYCWIYSTFTIPRYYSHQYQASVAHPGVGTYNSKTDDVKLYHTYYQWVPFILFFQALMFYSPHWLWKIWEGGKVQSTIAGLSVPIKSNQERQKVTLGLIEYLRASHRHHDYYAKKYLFCEFLSILNCILNILLLNKFLNGMFLDYGNKVLAYYQNDNVTTINPMTIVFPKVTKCSVPLYGASGSKEIKDLLCILALNNFNDKIFLFMWFWLIILSVLNTLNFIYHVLIFVIPHTRKIYLNRIAKDLQTSNFFNQVGDSFFLYLVKKNVDTLTFDYLFSNLFENLHNFSIDVIEKPKEKSVFKGMGKRNVLSHI